MRIKARPVWINPDKISRASISIVSGIYGKINDRDQLTQNHFSAFIYKFVTLIMKSEHFKTLMKRTPGTLLCL